MIVTLARTLAFSFSAGINLYATVAVLGLTACYDWVALPPQFEVFAHPVVIGTALVLYVVEFVADKVPWLDSAWDAVHTVIRPLGGALIAVAALGEASAPVEGLVALLGGGVAATTHVTKAGTRALANASPEPFSNWARSQTEDGLVVGLAFVALRWPLVSLAIVGALAALMAFFAATIISGVKRWSSGRRAGLTWRPR
jgi:hypothetical protein